jgi:hypothetical protein
MLFDQEIFVLKRPRSRLAREYRKLTWTLVRHNPADREGVLQALHRYEPNEGIPSYDRWEKDSEVVDQGLLAGDEYLEKVLEHYPNDADIIYKVAEFPYGDYQGIPRIKLLDRVLDVEPDHPDALLKRAYFKRREGDFSGAAADLVQYVQDHGLESESSLEALITLREVAPERFSEAVNCGITQGIGSESKYKLARFLAGRNTDLPRAIQLMKDYLADESSSDRKATATFFLQSYLIRDRRCREVVEQYEAKAAAVDEALSWTEPFNVAMAHWAQGRTAPAAFCREILQRLLQNERQGSLGTYEPEVSEREGTCWLLWWLGDNEKALSLLREGIELIRMGIKDRSMHWSQWSFWRYESVQLTQYLDDCQQFRRMIQSESIRPPFLGSSAEAR